MILKAWRRCYGASKSELDLSAAADDSVVTLSVYWQRTPLINSGKDNVDSRLGCLLYVCQVRIRAVAHEGI